MKPATTDAFASNPEPEATTGAAERRMSGWGVKMAVAAGLLAVFTLGAGAVSYFAPDDEALRAEIAAAKAKIAGIEAAPDGVVYRQTRALLATMAAAPQDFTSADYAAMGAALMRVDPGDKAADLLRHALMTATGAADEAKAARLLGDHAYGRGAVIEGDAYYARAISVWSRRPVEDAARATLLDVETLLAWAAASLAMGDRTLAEEKLVEAALLRATLPAGAQADRLAAEIAALTRAAEATARANR